MEEEEAQALLQHLAWLRKGLAVADSKVRRASNGAHLRPDQVAFLGSAGDQHDGDGPTWTWPVKG